MTSTLYNTYYSSVFKSVLLSLSFTQSLFLSLSLFYYLQHESVEKLHEQFRAIFFEKAESVKLKRRENGSVKIERKQCNAKKCIRTFWSYERMFYFPLEIHDFIQNCYQCLFLRMPACLPACLYFHFIHWVTLRLLVYHSIYGNWSCNWNHTEMQKKHTTHDDLMWTLAIVKFMCLCVYVRACVYHRE